MNIDEDISIRSVQYDDAVQLYDLIVRNAERLRDSFSKTLSFFSSIDDAKKRIAYLLESAENGTSFLFVVVHKESGSIIGVLIIKEIDRRAMKAELAYYIDAMYEGKGIITYGLKLLCYYAFDEVCLKKVYARVYPYNHSSKKVLIKNGFQLEGVLRNDFRNGMGELCNIEYYGLLK